MGKELPDEVIGFMGANWSKLGMVPAILWRLLEDKGWTYEKVHVALLELIGEDYADINLSTWIDRMIDKGNEEMIHSLEFDTPPVVDIVDHAIHLFYSK